MLIGQNARTSWALYTCFLSILTQKRSERESIEIPTRIVPRITTGEGGLEYLSCWGSCVRKTRMCTEGPTASHIWTRSQRISPVTVGGQTGTDPATSASSVTRKDDLIGVQRARHGQSASHGQKRSQGKTHLAPRPLKINGVAWRESCAVGSGPGPQGAGVDKGHAWAGFQCQCSWKPSAAKLSKLTLLRPRPGEQSEECGKLRLREHR
ncbi:hypothetical protein U0070_023283 [Myodes glareolus]|uniref:Secreted protein n=1 Tax=Myodes glareolus TaxID=447135 RepID=A0AAW0ICW5_MYOGA